MLTFDLWVATGRSFTDIAMPGEEVDKAIVDYFINVIMPASLQAGYVQMGEPHSFCEDENGEWRETYLTFSQNEHGQWIYNGPCFRGETKCRL